MTKETSEAIASIAGRIMAEVPSSGASTAYRSLLADAKRLAGSALSQREPDPEQPTGPGRYRKLPVVIEAYQFHNRIGTDDRPGWILEAEKAGTVTFHNLRHAPGYLLIVTLEGTMRADVGDWIIRGVNGEIYPCKPEIFEKTYEPAESQISINLENRAMFDKLPGLNQSQRSD